MNTSELEADAIRSENSFVTTLNVTVHGYLLVVSHWEYMGRTLVVAVHYGIEH